MIQGLIKRYSHYFEVFATEPRLRIALFDYMKEETLEMALEKKRGRFVMAPKRMWSRRSLRNGARAFNINEYDLFMEFMRKYNLYEKDFDIKNVKPYKGEKVNFDGESWTAFPQQEPLIEHALDKGHQKAITASPGFGKGSDLNANIRVPGGWVKMRNIKVGDIVTARDGTPTKVLGVYPQGLKRRFKFTFRDGRSTIVDDTHLWSVRWRHQMDDRVMSTLDIISLMEKSADIRSRISVPLIIPEDSHPVGHLIPPYVLGVILGDGSLSKSSVRICKPSLELYEIVKNTLPPEFEVSPIYKPSSPDRSISWEIRTSEYGRKLYQSNILMDELKRLGLDNRKSWEKFIPDEYKEGSLEERTDIVRGLMDTDGTVSKGGTIEYSTASQDLAEDIQYMIRSIGDLARITTRTPHYTYKGERKEGLTAYRVFVRSTDQSKMFSIDDKARRASRTNQYAQHLRLSITSIEEIEKGETQCIMVEHPEHLYVTDDFIVTHNTVCALLVAKALGVRFCVVTKGGYEPRWVPAFYDIIGLKPTEVRSCCGAKAIEKVVKEFKKYGPEETKAFFFSNGGLRDYIKNYEAGKYSDKKHPCHDVPPEKLFKFFGIGFKIVDEAHQESHAHYIIDLYTNLEHSLYLTGTLIPSTPFVAKIYERFIPERVRKSDDVLNIYAKAVEVMYTLNEPEKARYMGGTGGYSHVTFEQWVMKDPQRLKNWLDALYDYVVFTWAANRVEETKALIFGATIEFCAAMQEYFQRRMPDMRVVQYKAGDPYDLLIDNDIIFATLGKAGTAVDIPDLEQVYMTTAIDSGNANIQAFGRLRDLVKKFPELQLYFHWFTCMDIEKHVEYGKKKRKLLQPRVKGIRTEYLKKRI